MHASVSGQSRVHDRREKTISSCRAVQRAQPEYSAGGGGAPPDLGVDEVSEERRERGCYGVRSVSRKSVLPPWVAMEAEPRLMRSFLPSTPVKRFSLGLAWT